MYERRGIEGGWCEWMSVRKRDGRHSQTDREREEQTWRDI